MAEGLAPIEMFCCYAREDELWLRELDIHLSLLKRQGLISFWHDRLIVPGADWAKAIDTHLETASVIVLLVSADFFASDYCYGIEMQCALEREAAGEARVIPLLVRPVDWKDTPFAHLQVLPTDTKPIASWPNKDTALADVAAGIRRVIVEELPQLAASAPRAALPRIWNVPYPRNPFFLGRDTEMAAIRQRLQAGQPTALSQPQAISGLGGIGKTQLALEYAYRYHQDYQAVLWAHAESTDALISSYVTLATLLRLPERDAKEQEVIVQTVKIWLQTHRDWLLILDNADELALLPDFLPPSPGGHLLLTTRAAATGRLAHRLEIETLLPEHGAVFLLRRAAFIAPDDTLRQASQEEKELAMQIVQDLGGLPLALDQAGAYLEETGIGLATYRLIYQQHQADLLRKRGGLIDDHPAAVATTWALSFARVEQQNPVAADLLRLCAFLAPDAIPEEILTKGALHLGAMLASALADPFLFTQAIEILRAVSLLKRDPQAHLLSVHRLVQTILRNDMGKETTQYWAEQAIKMVAAVLPAPREYFHQKPTWERLLAHALTCAELAWSNNLSMIEAISLLQLTGAYLSWCYRDKEAESLLERSLVMSATVYGEDCLEIVDSMENLAFIYHRQDRYEEAESLFMRSLAVHRQHFGPEHPDTAESLNLLASCYLRQGRYEETELLYQQALTIYEQQLGPEHRNTASIIHNLASLYERQGRNEEAKPLFLRALTIYKQYLEADNSDAPFFKNLGYLYLRQNLYAEAEISFQREVTAWELSAGSEHLTTTVGLGDLILLYEKLGEYEKAEPLYQQAIALHERVLGPDHPKGAYLLNDLAMLYYQQGKYAEAEPLFQRTLLTRKQALGPQHPQTAETMHSLALLREAQGSHEEARSLYDRTLKIREQMLGVHHPKTTETRMRLTALLYAMGQHEEAVKLEEIQSKP